MKIIMISRYPSKSRKHSNTSGIASYTKNLVNSLKLHNINILSDKKNGQEIYNEDKNIQVINCWSELFFPVELLWTLLKFKNKIDLIHIQYDTYLYGKMSITFFPIFLFLLRAYRIPIIITMHSAISQISINRKFLKDNGIAGSPFILKIGYYLMTISILHQVKRIVVHNDNFKEIYFKDYNINKRKINVVNHGIELPSKLYEKCDARDCIGIDKSKKVILFFGYISKYKGLNNLIDAYGYLDNNKYILIIAGGEHPRLKNDNEYRQYILCLKNKAINISKNIIFTGFVDEDMIPIYFCSADVIVLPYTQNISSSGPLTLAITYDRPFLVSEEFRNIVPISDIIFKNTPINIAQKINEFFENDDINIIINKYSKKLKNDRNWNKIAEIHNEIYIEAMK
jgi:glycosyltransferase involved in cell wall biosynthesis